MIDAPSRLIVWGHGCVAAACVIIDLEPRGDAIEVRVDVGRPDHRRPREQASVLLPKPEAERAVDAILAEVADETNARDPFHRTGIGNVSGKLFARGAVTPLWITDDAPDHLVRVASAVLALVSLAGLEVTDDLFPIPRNER